MADKKVGVLVVHGMGSQSKNGKKKEDTTELSFSKDLYAGFSQSLRGPIDQVAWHEVSWSFVTQNRQENYLNEIAPETRWDWPRNFVMRNLSDAACYRPASDKNDKTYKRIHREVNRTLGRMEKEIGPEGAIIIAAHSLGGHIMSNYIYDAQNDVPDPGSAPQAQLKDMRSVVQIVTFGCNIPVFVMGYKVGEIDPIKPPNTAVPPDQRLRSWWRNYYDADDILGYPLAPLGPNYQELARKKHLVDSEINVGRFRTSWGPLSHVGYWQNGVIAARLARTADRIIDRS